MAYANKCDRCKTFFEVKDRGVIGNAIAAVANAVSKLTTKDYYNVQDVFDKVDLCPSCKKDFMAWWRKREPVSFESTIGSAIADGECGQTEAKIKVKLDSGAFAPESAHDTDAGYDLRTPVDCCVCPGGFIDIDTGVHIEIPKGYVGFLKSKSGLNVKDLLTGEGVIDSGYTGSIRVKLYQHRSGAGKKFNRGDKIIQIVLLPIFKPEIEIVDELEETERGDGGFGSTGR